MLARSKWIYGAMLPIALFSAVLGCGPREAAPARDECAVCEEFLAEKPRHLTPDRTELHETDPVDGARARVLHEQPRVAGLGGFETVRIGAQAAEPRAARPRSRGRVNVELVDASFEDVARFLSDAGGFNVVVDVATSPVTARLAGVDAYEALLALAEVRGLSVDYRDGIARVMRK